MAKFDYIRHIPYIIKQISLRIQRSKHNVNLQTTTHNRLILRHLQIRVYFESIGLKQNAHTKGLLHNYKIIDI